MDQQLTLKETRRLTSAQDVARRVLLEGVEKHVYPGASAAIGWAGGCVLVQAGRLRYAPEAPAVEAETLYDLASLTKVVATTPMAMLLVDRQWLDLDAAIADYLPEFLEAEDALAEARSRVIVRHLLAHTSGLPSYVKFYQRARRPSHVWAEALAVPLECEPGRRTLYSDVGFILLGAILQRAAARHSPRGISETLDQIIEREIFQPLGMSHTIFNPPLEVRPSIAPTEQDDDFRHRLIQGEVHDENAWVMGGVAPHAGLFSTAADLAQFCQFMLNEGSWQGRQLIRTQTIREFSSSFAANEGAPRGLGWDKPSTPSSSGRYFSEASIGHLGFTGTSLWIDPQRRLFVVLLTNRIHPTRSNEAIREFRPAFHDAVVSALEG